MNRSRETEADIDKAAALFCDTLELVKSFRVGGSEVAGVRAARMLRAAPAGRRRIVGRHVLQKYRRQTGRSGRIDWEKFHQWLKDHMAELTLAKVILSVISILLIL